MKTFGCLTVFLVTLLSRHIDCGLYKRTVREVYPEVELEREENFAQTCIVGDVVYEVDEPVPAEQPCLKCKCQPPGVQCETTVCVKKPGCKAIHRPNKCCPDYLCECEYKGRNYANGERLETDSDEECRVCYCRGGEIQCANVSCYIRDDCEGRTVKGQCCPKYDHCPPKEPNASIFKNTTANQEKLYTENAIQENEPYKQMEKVNITIQEILDAETESSELFHSYQQPPDGKEENKTIVPNAKELETDEMILRNLNNEASKNDSSNGNSHILSLVKKKNKQKPAMVKNFEANSTDDYTRNMVITEETTEFNFGLNDTESEDPFGYYFTESYENRTASLENDTMINEMNATTESNLFDINDTVDQALEENPAYPPIPDFMVPHVNQEETELIDSELIQNTTDNFSQKIENSNDSKLLPEILEIRNNKTIPQNSSHPEWLKQHNYNKTTLIKNSKETLEDPFEDSGELTTVKNTHASLLSNEDASVDVPEMGSPETAELVELLPEEQETRRDGKDVELRDLAYGGSVVSGDVEMFDPEQLKKAENPERIIKKRENAKVEEEGVFDELVKEIEESEDKKRNDGDVKSLRNPAELIGRVIQSVKRSKSDANIVDVLRTYTASLNKY